MLPRAVVKNTHRGNAYYDLGNYQSAMSDYTEALKLNDAWIKNYRSDVEANLKKARAQSTKSREL